MLNLQFDVEQYHQQLNEIEADETAVSSKVSHLKGALNQLKKDFFAQHWFVRCFTFVAYKWRCFVTQESLAESQAALSNIPDRQTAALKTLVLNAGRQYMLNSDRAAELKELEKRHASLSDLYVLTNNTIRAGKDALTAISEAITSVESAKSLEVIDAVSKSRSISIVSSAQNSSASSATSRARQAIEQYQRCLQDQAAVFEKPDHSMTVEYLDLTVDMLFDGGALDVLGSVMSYFALSSTASQLRRAYQQIEPVHDKVIEQQVSIHDQVKRHEAQMLTFKQAAREAILPLLAKFDITVSAEFASGLTDLYAPSAKQTVAG